MSIEENKAIAARFYEALNDHDMEAASEVIAPDLVAHLPGTRGPLDLEGYGQMGAMMMAAFPDLHLTMEDVIAEGDRVVTRLRERGTHQGELMGIPPTGRRVEYTGISIDRIEGGKIVEHWVNFDMLGLMQQLGVIPSPEEQAGA